MNCYDILGKETKCWDNLGNSFWIDTEDLEKIKSYYFSLHGNDGYFSAVIKGKRVYLHRFIMNAPKGMVVDHINHLREDNRKCNLRVCTQQENTRNRASSGVSKRCDTNRWEAYVFMANKKIHLGYFATKEEALMARKNGEKKYYKEFAYNA